MEEYIDKSDCGLTFLQVSGDAVKTVLFGEEQFLKGKNVRPQFPGRNVGLMFGFESSLHPFIRHPAYKEIAHLSLEERYQIMKDPEFKSKLLSQEPDLEGELQKRLADKSNYKTEEELIKDINIVAKLTANYDTCLLYTSPSPRDMRRSRMPSSA